MKLLPAIEELINFLSPKSILDYGCGKGLLVRTLAQKYPTIKVYGYDPGVQEFENLPEDKIDFVINTDVLEHIPQEELPETIQLISCLSRNVFFHLNHTKAIAILPNGENAHCTIWSLEKYYELFKGFFPYVTLLPGLSAINSSAVTFELPQEIKDRISRVLQSQHDQIVLNKALNQLYAKSRQMVLSQFDKFFIESLRY